MNWFLCNKTISWDGYLCASFPAISSSYVSILSTNKISTTVDGYLFSQLVPSIRNPVCFCRKSICTSLSHIYDSTPKHKKTVLYLARNLDCFYSIFYFRCSSLWVICLNLCTLRLFCTFFYCVFDRTIKKSKPSFFSKVKILFICTRFIVGVWLLSLNAKLLVIDCVEESIRERVCTFI